MKYNRKGLFISTVCIIAFSGIHSAMAYDTIAPNELSCKIRIVSDDAFSGGRVAYGGINPVYEIGGIEYYPLRHVTECLGMSISWDEVNTRVDIDTNTDMLFPYRNTDSYLMGYMDINGKVIIDPVYSYADNFFEGMAAVRSKENGLYGFIDNNGDMVIPYMYYDADGFSDGLAKVCTEIRNSISSDYIYIDKNGDQAFDKVFNYGYSNNFNDDLAVYLKEGWVMPGSYASYAFMNKNGDPVNDMQFEEISSGFYNGYAAVKNNGKWAIMNNSFELVTDYVFDTEEEAWTSFETYIPSKVNYIINSDGEPVTLENDIYIINDMTYLSMKDLSEVLGFDIQQSEYGGLLINPVL